MPHCQPFGFFFYILFCVCHFPSKNKLKHAVWFLVAIDTWNKPSTQFAFITRTRTNWQNQKFYTDTCNTANILTRIYLLIKIWRLLNICIDNRIALQQFFLIAIDFMRKSKKLLIMKFCENWVHLYARTHSHTSRKWLREKQY